MSITESQLLAGYLDRDGDDLSVTTLTLADDSIGTLSGDATTGWTFSPNPDWNGTVELNYSISDGQGVSNSTINVSNSFQVFAVNDAPTYIASDTDAANSPDYSFANSDPLSGLPLRMIYLFPTQPKSQGKLRPTRFGPEMYTLQKVFGLQRKRR